MKKQSTFKTMQKKLSLGQLIFGIINGLILGLLSLAVSLQGFFTINNKEVYQQGLKILQESGVKLNLTVGQFKLIFLAQSIISLLFIISGAGIILRKEWGRRFTVYYAVVLAILIFLPVVLLKAVNLNFAVQLAYLAAMVFYFTNKKVESAFKRAD